MRKLLLFLYFSLSSLLSQSIYPLLFTFDDSSFFMTYVGVYKPDMPQEIKYIGAILNDAEHNSLTFNDKIILSPICPEIKTLDEFINYKNISKKCYVFIENISKNSSFSQIELGNGIKILLFEAIVENTIIKTTFWQVNAIIFHSNKLLGTLNYFSPFNNKKKFYSLLQTIELNKNIKKIDEYIKDGNKYIDKGFINLAVKNAFSALFLEPTNKNIKPLWEKIQDKQKLLIEANEIDWGKLEE
jgi:hypothetical protein